MAKKEKKPQEQTFIYKGKVYKVNDFNENQIDDFNQYLDLSNKRQKMAFNLRQLNGGCQFYESQIDKHIEEYNQKK